MDYVNEQRIHVLGMKPEAVVSTLNFTIVDKKAKPVYVGVWVSADREYYLRPIL